MARKAPSVSTLRELFAKSGNQCAFPGCNHTLIDDDGEFVAEICHIEAANEGGERYNSAMSDEERRSSSNLLIMCHMHHVKTNNTERYDIEKLKEIKRIHEKQFSESEFSVPQNLLQEIAFNESVFWQSIKHANKTWLSKFDLAMPINSDLDPLDLLNSVQRHLGDLQRVQNDIHSAANELPRKIDELVNELGKDGERFINAPYYIRPDVDFEWESFNLAIPNFMAKIFLDLNCLRIHLLFWALKENPHNSIIEEQLVDAKHDLEKLAQSAGYID